MKGHLAVRVRIFPPLGGFLCVCSFSFFVFGERSSLEMEREEINGRGK